MTALTIHNRNIPVLTGKWADYELLDSGNRQKLERFGDYVLIREEAKAWWRPELPEAAWKNAVAAHLAEDNVGWVFRNKALPAEWLIQVADLTIEGRITATSKHIGIFPEQYDHWRWIGAQIEQAARPIRLLNLFGYIGVASLIAAKHGASVTHVDSAKGIVTWARRNQQLSGLDTAPIRWIVDDAATFVKREVRRARQYDAIILDPPTFGRGPKGELWQNEEHLVALLADCRQLLSEQPLLIVMTLYSISQSALLISNLLHDMMQPFGGVVDVGEFALQPENSPKILPMSIFGRWSHAA